ncbi:WD domain-containing protein, G-beta repeat-containing protein [Franzmannia pantelleriensis]|uniref:WD domain-containing protein, G-beta repeat-containing protein n=1 Tax=Franzmannia pantelleriensis TaxID=48727 RepID=A0A1G9PM84_9GAMM|nr:hypothetical protein [Halomonas pantelleriensis]SDL99814.1 WD domain-containing protein, G-beta repeat-containing protein [Halomonas pantelleriensis]
MFHRWSGVSDVQRRGWRYVIALGLAVSASLAWAQDGGSPDWSAADMQHELELEASVTQLAFSPDGALLASATESSLKVWDLASGRLKHRLDGHRSPEVDRALPVTGLAFSPDGSLLASTSWNPGVMPDASLKLWDPATGEPRQALAGGQGCREVAFSATGDSVWAACGRDVQRYSLETGGVAERAEHFPSGLLPQGDAEAAAAELPMPRQGPATALALSEEGMRLAWAGQPPTYPMPILRVWQAEMAAEADYLVLDLPGVTTTHDPVALARDHYSRELPNPVTEERIEQWMRDSGEVRVMLTLNNLKDDASRAWRYRLTFTPREDGRWELVRIERKHQCRRGPTEPDEWTTRPCV